MTTKMFSTSVTLVLLLLLLSILSIGGEGIGEWNGSDGNESGSGAETSTDVTVTSSTSATSFTTSPQTERQTACGPGNLRAVVRRSGKVKSPNFPKKYQPNSECWWTITAPVGHLIRIKIIKFTLETCCDFFRLYDAPSRAEATQPFRSVGSKDHSSPFIESRSNYLTIEFTSDQSVQKQGFKLMYRATTFTCPGLLAPINGNRLCDVYRNNTFYCKFSCQRDFQLLGSKQRWCQANETWSGNQVTCEKKTCSEPPVPENGRLSCMDGRYVGSACSFTCNDGYELFGSKSRLCHYPSLLWDGYDTSCQGSPPTTTCNVRREVICDGKYDCADHTDEMGCTCPQYKFKCDCYGSGCRIHSGCIKPSCRCDGKNDCGDMSDERDCQCSETWFQCKDGDCIDRSKVNDGNIDCVHGDDEFVCNMTQGHVKCDCMHDDDRCTSSDRCIPNSWIGDTIPDCENHKDEPCNASKFWCEECWVIINQCSTNQGKHILLRHSLDNATRCRSLTIPSDQKQTLETNWVCTTSPCGKCQEVFRCQSGQFICNEHYCDTIPQCKDGSDDLARGFGFRCSGKHGKSDCALPQKNVYDSVAQCADGSDLCFVNGEFRCYLCLDGKLIVSAKQVCDGIVDCYDMSDECLCANQSVCDAVRGDEKSRCPSNQMHCYNDTDCVDMDKVLCNSSVDCPSGSSTMFCHQDEQSGEQFRCSVLNPLFGHITISALRCDGRPECGDMSDECRCAPQPSFCDGRCSQKARENLYGNTACDGYVNFVEDSSCGREEEKNCPMRFECKSKDMISIDKLSLCDGIIDCDDHSDENIANCGNKRFYCSGRNSISIDKAFVCDGIKDCDKGEDEATHLCGESPALFSDQYEMVASPVLQALFWIMGILALSGNILINIYTTKDVFFCKNDNVPKLGNDIFILNLTISDFLMGVYLIAVVAQGKIYSGFYGLVDREWRSSSACSGLGTLAVLSSETSVFIMAAMSTFRLVTVCKPLLSSFIKIKWIVIAGCSCWIFSFLLAAIPWFPFESGYFVSDAWFPNLFFKSYTVSKHDMFTLAKRGSNDSSTLKSWLKVKDTISYAFKYNPIKGEFGYYGKTSVCMPRFYVSTSEAAWEYSTFLITLNFLLFIYMLVVYLLVCKKVSDMKKSRSTKKDPNKGMQNRISRLLLTDFCCWIPVCIMGYLSVAGVALPSKAYVASAGFLLPINSAMNPILYSKFVDQKASRAKNWIIQNFSNICSCSAREAGAVERRDARLEDTELRVIEENN